MYLTSYLLGGTTMNLIKSIEYNKQYDDQLFKVELEYGMKDDKSNHELMLKIWHVTNEERGTKHIVVKEEITDLTAYPQIYEGATNIYIDNLEEIRNYINERIELIASSNRVNNIFKEVLQQLEEEERK